MRLCAALAAVQIMAVCLVPQYEGTRFKRIAYGDRNVSSLWRSIVVQLQHVGSHSNVHMCGGTLVSSDLVLTAAHCLSGKEELRLKFTSNDPLCVNDTGKFVAVMPLIHRSFTDMTWLSVTTHRPLRRSKIFFNDIAALQLKSTIDCLTNVIPPTVISMTTSKFITNETLCHVVGWGATEGNIRPRSPVLKKAKVQLLPEETCSTAYGLDFSALPSELLCATDPTHQGLDACEGDSGSPLICKINNVDYFAGLVSVGAKDCGKKANKLPGIYTHLGQFESWIKAIQSKMYQKQNLTATLFM